MLIAAEHLFGRQNPLGIILCCPLSLGSILGIDRSLDISGGSGLGGLVRWFLLLHRTWTLAGRFGYITSSSYSEVSSEICSRSCSRICSSSSSYSSRGAGPASLI
ncbi:hypothetical protein L211DRAFT_528874 [Terfezia boudieri ATCC MYA-4762]|uniref:Uncharacterized protein n=1 Tax=Terfezia boudieri ATCC MYA-4762 TaxID=1051890 RepID=A0A3N4LBD2_9PEZI|nr:hypothetical protein L211DRAFT_528874 [Terfezia boudieri ATCC MYA-4762]